jgi:hypothetical protein
VTTARQAGKVLILSPHVMTAALVGWYVELAELEPAFAEPGELPHDALARVRPVLVVLVDTELPGAMSDLLVARTVKRGAGLALFTGRPVQDDVRHWATAHEVPLFNLPIDLEAFGRVLDQAARQQGGDRRVGQRRGGPSMDRAVDGTPVFHDPSGRVWYVYDRRYGDRRGADTRAGDYRAFIDAAGAERRCVLGEGDDTDRDPDALAAQFARSEPV